MNTYDIKNIKPAPGFLIVKPNETQAEVAGIIQPNKDQEVPQWGVAIALGKPLEDTPQITGLELNATVIYKQWGGNKVEVGGVKYYFLKYEEIIGVALK